MDGASRHHLRVRLSAPDATGGRGVALMSTLVLMAVLAVSMAVSAHYLYFAKTILREDWEKKQAFYLAESGLEQAIAGLLQGQGTEAARPHTRLGPGDYWVEIKREANRPETYRIVSSGQVGGEFGPVTKLIAVVRVRSLYGGQSRRVETLSWQEEASQPTTQPTTTQPAATQAAATGP